jgi:thioredoxin 1
MLLKTLCITLTEANFQAEVLDSRIPVLVDCWASWCRSLQQVNPMFDELAIELTGQVKVGRLNIAAAENLAAHYGIRAVPTLLLFKDGQMLERVVGSADKQSLTRQIRTLQPGTDANRSRIACL